MVGRHGNVRGLRRRQPDGHVADLPARPHLPRPGGSYAVTLSATSAAGTTKTATRTVTIQPLGDIKPALAFSQSPQDTLHVTASAAGTVSPWLATDYTIDFGDHTPATTVTGSTAPTAVDHEYATAGTYTVTETVTDDHGRTGTTSQTLTVSSADVPTPPARILDTRLGLGAPTAAVGPGQTLKLQVIGHGGVPADGKVTSVLLNLTAASPTADTVITAYAGGTVPNVSNLNPSAGHDAANAVLVPVAPDGTVSFYNHTGNVQLVADVQGYYTTAPGPAGLNLSSWAPQPRPRHPCQHRRDQRTGRPRRHHSRPRPGPDCCPRTPRSRSAPTATEATDDSFISADPVSMPPTTSSLNFTANQTVANQITVPINSDGTVTLYNHTGNVHLVADIQGYYSPTSGSEVVTTAPTRLLEHPRHRRKGLRAQLHRDQGRRRRRGPRRRQGHRRQPHRHQPHGLQLARHQQHLVDSGDVHPQRHPPRHRPQPRWSPSALTATSTSTTTAAPLTPSSTSRATFADRLELAGESVRVALEALAIAAPAWLRRAMPVAELELRYAARVDSWRLPSSKTKRDRLAEVHGQDALALLHAWHAPDAPVWLREIKAVQLLRRIFMQSYYVHSDAQGREVVRKREAEKDGVPPGDLRLASPYDPHARWSAKGDELFWCGYKVHLTETCDDSTDGAAAGARTRTPNLITDVATTLSTAPDVTATAGIQQRLTERQVKPGEHCLDSGYPSADLVTAAAHEGIAMIRPLLADHSR